MAGGGEDIQQGHPSARSLPYTANADISMEACCTDGNQMANQHRDCSLPYTSESKECRYVCSYHCLTSHAHLEASGRKDSVHQMSEMVMGTFLPLCF